MNGSGRGTALVVLTVGLPLLAVSVLAARRGSSLALLTWLGALGLLAYNALMFLFATPFNPLFLLYVAWLALTVWSVGLLLAGMDVDDLAGRFADSAPRRGVATYIWVVAAANALLWLRTAIPALFDGGQSAVARGTGVTTNVVYIQDLALWLPLMVVVAGWLWRGRAWGLVLAAGGLVMWVLESISIAVDQAYGAAADPTSSVASLALTPVFAGLAVIGTIPTLLLLRGFDHEGLMVKAARLAPPADRRTPETWAIGATALTVAGLAAYGSIALARNDFDLPSAWLEGTPFTSWVGPGLALLVGVALPQLGIATLVAVRSRWARVAALAGGVTLIAWVVLQLVVLQQPSILQPVIAATGVLELWLARHQKRSGA